MSTKEQWAGSFGADPERYDRARPRYPQPLIDRVAARAHEVLDVGCGTGIVARQLTAAGCQVLGVDHDERMAALAGVAVEIARFESWDADGRTFDAVVSGQTWHWIDPHEGAKKAAEVLRPGGRLYLFWNAAQPPPELSEAFAQIYRRIIPDVPIFDPRRSAVDVYTAGLTRAEEGMRAHFGEPERWRDDWQRDYTRDEWLDQIPSLGGHSLLPPAKLEELLDGIGNAVDAAGGGFTMQYATLTTSAEVRLPAS